MTVRAFKRWRAQEKLSEEELSSHTTLGLLNNSLRAKVKQQLNVRARMI